jgi:hypothetical protein
VKLENIFISCFQKGDGHGCGIAFETSGCDRHHVSFFVCSIYPWVVVIIFIPIVIGDQIWAYHLFKGKVTQADLAHDEAY